MLGGIISGMGQLFGGIAQKIGQRKQYEREKADNISLWKMQNAYNSPKEQMKRLEEAGLNPHLVYQSGNAIQPAGDVSVNPSDGTSGFKDMGESLNTGYQAYLQGKSIMSQNRQRDVQSDLTEQKIKSEEKSQRMQDLLAYGTFLDNKIKEIDARYKGEEKQSELKKLRTEININEQNLRNLFSTNENIQADTRNKVADNKLKQQQSKQMQQQYEFNAKNNITLLQQGKATLQETLSKIALNQANVLAINQNREYTKKQIEALAVQIENSMVERLSKQLGITEQVIGLKYSDKLQSLDTQLKEYDYQHRLFKPLLDGNFDVLKKFDRGRTTTPVEPKKYKPTSYDDLNRKYQGR